MSTSPQTLSQMIDAGRYAEVFVPATWMRPDRAPVEPHRFTTADLEVVCFNKNMTTAQIEAELGPHRRAARAEELLAYGAENPDEQLKYPIRAVGSHWTHPRGFRIVLCLHSVAGRRWLAVDPDSRMRVWHANDRFLIARNP